MNLGKSKITPLEQAAEDYTASFRALRDYIDFFVVNVSSPNTPGLRQLQDKAALDEILAALQEENSRATPSRIEPATSSPPPPLEKRAGERRPKPILVKIAPDLSFEALDEILALAASRNLAGIVATNTTITRPQSQDAHLQKIYSETGGLSGCPLGARSTEIIRHIFRQTRGKLPIIGVGGIFNAADAWKKITAGASLIQIYTGLVYEGPTAAREIVSGLIQLLKTNGCKQFTDAVGSSLNTEH
jgi:dihydroorotate dehydrogenase